MSERRENWDGSPERKAVLRRIAEAGEVPIDPKTMVGLNAKYTTPLFKGGTHPPVQGEWISGPLMQDFLDQGVVELSPSGDSVLITEKGKLGQLKAPRVVAVRKKVEEGDEDNTGLVFEEVAPPSASSVSAEVANGKTERINKTTRVQLTGEIKLKGKEGVALATWVSMPNKTTTIETLAMRADVQESSAKYCIRKALARGAARIVE